MPRIKKSRKPGAIGASKSTNKSPDFSRRAKNKLKPTKGKPSGNKQNVAESGAQSQSSCKNLDPRHGSKKLIPLQVVKTQPVKYKSPSEELNAIEADTKLASLLDKQEKGDTLRIDQKDYIVTKLARHASLCELLGIDTSEGLDEQTSEKQLKEDDPFAALDAMSISDFED